MPVYRADTALMATLGTVTRQAAQELGQWNKKSETAAFDPVERVRRLHEGRNRVFDFAVAQELKARRAARELEQGQAKSEPSTISGS
jgi:hypothetical protein